MKCIVHEPAPRSVQKRKLAWRPQSNGALNPMRTAIHAANTIPTIVKTMTPTPVSSPNSPSIPLLPMLTLPRGLAV